MDDNNINGLDNNEEPLAFDEADTEISEKEEPGEELQKELEGIRDLFQKELDSATDENNITYESPTGEVLIQGLDEIGVEFDETSENVEIGENDFEDDDVDPEEDDVVDDEDLCQCCGENPRNTDYGDDYPYCDDCRALMLHNPLNLVGVIVSFFVLIVAGVSIWLMVSNIDQYSTLVDAEMAYDSKNLSSAGVSYYNYLNSVSPESIHSSAAVKQAAEVFVKLGYLSDSRDIIDKFFTEEQLEKPWNRRVKTVKEYIQDLFDTDEFITEKLGEMLQTGEYDKALEAIEPLLAENEKNIESEEAHNQAYLEYIKYYILHSKGEDEKKLIELLDHIKEIDEKYYGGQNNWLYLTPFVNCYAMLGDVENAKKYSDLILDVNKQDIYSYMYLADAYRFSLNSNSTEKEITAAADGIIDLAGQCEKMYDSQVNYPPYYYRFSAIGYLLKGENEMAMQSMENFMNGAGQNITINDYHLYAVCALQNGDTDKYQNTKEMFKNYDQTLPKSILKLEKGKTTAFEIIIEKGGDI